MNLLTATSTEFLAQFDALFKTFDYHQYASESMSDADWKKLVKAGILLPIIPKAYGGRESHEEVYLLMKKAAYYNLGLAMYINATMLLFARSIIGYGSEKIKKEVIEDLINNGSSGGFAVIEPETGSGTALMQTYFEKVPGGYRITGKKHWQCLSESADWWLIVAKDRLQGAEGRKFDLFVYQRSTGGFTTKQRYDTVGLKLIDFGLNELDVTVPEYARLEIDSSTFADLLNLVVSGGWGQWASFGSGFLTRIYEEAVNYTKQRVTVTGTLNDIAYVRYRIGTISASRNVCSAIFNYLLRSTNILRKGTEDVFASQSAKVLAADSVFNAAINYQELCGGEGYRYHAKENIAAHAMQDARAFTILGLANDFLYELITRDFLKCYRLKGEKSIYAIVRNAEPTSSASSYLQSDHPLLEKIPVTNTEMIFAGRVLVRLFGIHATLLSEELSAADQSAAIALCRSEIMHILTEFSFVAEITI